jgi:hypothetical protein
VAVNALLGQSSLRPADLAAIEVTDLGNRFTITIRGRTREYVEASRNCEQRARMAAVFVALTLAPPDIAVLDEPVAADQRQRGAAEANLSAPAAASVTAERTTTAAPMSRVAARAAAVSAWHVEGDLAAHIALDPARPRTAWGGLARGVLSGASWGTAFGFHVLARESVELQGVRVNESRYTAYLGIQRNWELGELRASAEFGPSLTWLQLQQAALPTDGVTRWLAGVKTGAYLTLSHRSVSPFFGLDLHVVPYRIPIAVEPQGTIGHTSAFWLGASLGIALSVD